MKDITTVGLDLAKNVFYVHGVDSRGKTVLKKKLSRAKLLEFFANLQPCLVGMEAGGGSNYWAREIKKLGHDAKIMAAQFVKPYVKTNKNDENDAEAICEALARPNMRFVSAKSVDQQDIQSVHRIRQRLVESRSSLACEIRGLLGEYGIVIPQGIREIPKAIPTILADSTNELTSFTRKLIQDLFSELLLLTEQVEKYNRLVQKIHDEHPIAKRLTTIPGVGPIAATAILASASDPSLFKNGREFAAYFGLVPRQSSSGGKQNLLGISKRGDKYIRMMLVHGARAAVGHNKNLKGESQKRLDWVRKLREKKNYNKTAVALANKNARTIWALLNSGESFRQAA